MQGKTQITETTTMINRYILITLISAFLLIGLAGASTGADIAPNTAENLAISGIPQDTSPSLNVQDGAGTTSTTVSNPRAPVRKRPTLKQTPVPTTAMTTAPTTVPTTITTTVPTKALTTVPTTVPTTTTAAPNQAEIQARVDAAYANGYARLAEMQAAHRSWSVPSRPDLVAIATNARSAGLKGDGVTDDTVALQSLLNQLPAGSTIYFPPAHYRIDGPITIAKPFTLFGESGTVFDCQKATEYIFTINSRGASSSITGMAITGIVFEGPGIETSPAMIRGYYLQNFRVSHSKFHNIGYCAIEVNSCIDVIVEDCIFDNIFRTGDGYGVCITDHSDRITIRDSFFVNKGRHGVTTGTANRNLLEEDFVRSVTVENSYFEEMSDDAINSHNRVIKGPYIVKNNVFNNCGKGVQFGDGIADVQNNIMINCAQGVVLKNNYKDPDNLDSKIDIVSYNTMINTKYEAIFVNRTNVVVENNIAKGGNRGSGIYIGNYLPNVCVIKNNLLEQFHLGIEIVNPKALVVSEGNYQKEYDSYRLI